MPGVGLIKHITYLLILLAGLLGTPALAQAKAPAAINFVVVSNQGIYRQIIDDIKQTLAARKLSVDTRIIEISTRSAQPVAAEGHFITIGTQAAAYTYQHYPNAHITSALLTRSGFEQLSLQAFGEPTPPNHTITALLLDQPLSRKLKLGTLLVPEAKTVGVLVGPANRQQQAAIEHSILNAGLTPRFALLNTEDNPIAIIEPVMSQSDFFVVLADRKRINQTAAKWLLSLSYRYRVPIIAYSQKYVDAGALGSVFYSPQNIAHAIVEAVFPVSNADYCPQFTVATNAAVARALGIQLQSIDAYNAQLSPCQEASR